MTFTPTKAGVFQPRKAFRWIIIALAAVVGIGAILTLPVTSALAQQSICGPRDTIVAKLKSGYHEDQFAIGMTGNGMLAELFVSKSGTWTMVFTRTDGISRLMAAGEHWETLPPMAENLNEGTAS